MSGSCSECGLFPRVQSLRVCSACWTVAQENAHRELTTRLRDPDAGPPSCHRCNRVETPDEEAEIRAQSGEDVVSMCALERDQETGSEGWVCSQCMFEDSDGEEWKP